MSFIGAIIQSLAILFGIVWIWINIYQFYPVFGHFTGKLIRAVRGEDTDRSEAEDLARMDGGTHRVGDGGKKQ